MQHSNGVVNINLDGVHSNIVMIDIIKDGLTSVELCKRLEQVNVIFISLSLHMALFSSMSMFYLNVFSFKF